MLCGKRSGKLCVSKHRLEFGHVAEQLGKSTFFELFLELVIFCAPLLGSTFCKGLKYFIGNEGDDFSSVITVALELGIF